MKVYPTKGKYKGQVMELVCRIKGTSVYKAKYASSSNYTYCYLHDKELNGFDRIRIRQNVWSRIRAKTWVKFWFFCDDLKRLRARLLSLLLK